MGITPPHMGVGPTCCGGVVQQSVLGKKCSLFFVFCFLLCGPHEFILYFFGPPRVFLLPFLLPFALTFIYWLGLATFCPLLSFYFFFSFALLFGPIKWSSRLKATTIPTKRNTIHLHLYQFNSNLIIKQYFTIKYQMQELG